MFLLKEEALLQLKSLKSKITEPKNPITNISNGRDRLYELGSVL